MDQMSSYPRILFEAKKADFEAKAVLLRLDLDVPLAQLPATSLKLEASGKKLATVADATRLEETLDTVKWLLDSGARITVIGHLGRPEAINHKSQITNHKQITNIKLQITNGKWQTDSRYSLRPVYEWYKTRLGDNPNFRMLENLRFETGEEGNSPEFAKRLVAETGAEIYVFEAFGVSHRTHASVVQIPKLLPTYTGFRFEKEIEMLKKVQKSTKKYKKVQKSILVIGGTKGETKIPLIKKLSPKFDQVLVGGRMPLEIGNLKFEIRNLKTAELKPDQLDITEKSAREFAEIIKSAGVVVWNGPMGKFEEFTHERGTRIVVEAVNETKAFTVAGGGDTEAALSKFDLEKGIDWISSGGGAMLTYLAEGTLPFLEVMSN